MNSNNSENLLSSEQDERLSFLSVLDLLKSSDDELMDRYGRFYIPRREPRYLRRNALLVLANGAPLEALGTADALREAVNHEDPILRAHGVWAAQRLGRFDLAESADNDPDARVREESRRPVPLLDMLT